MHMGIWTHILRHSAVWGVGQNLLEVKDPICDALSLVLDLVSLSMINKCIGSYYCTRGRDMLNFDRFTVCVCCFAQAMVQCQSQAAAVLYMD